MIWGLGAAALAGGAYYYFQENPDEKAKLEAKAKRSEEEVMIKSIEVYEAAKARGEDAVNRSKLEYEDAKVRFAIWVIENIRYRLLNVTIVFCSTSIQHRVQQSTFSNTRSPSCTRRLQSIWLFRPLRRPILCLQKSRRSEI